MPANAIRQFNITAFGQLVEGYEVSIGETVLWNFACQDPQTRVALDLTNGNVQMSVCALDERGLPVYPAVISHQATIESPDTDGNCNVEWLSGDTCPIVDSVAVPLPAGLYGVDLVLTDVDGNRLFSLLFMRVRLNAVATLPGTVITPGPAQLPLAQGPPGLGLDYTFQSATYNARFLDLVVGDPTAASFNVVLPVIASLASPANGLIVVVHGSTSGNTIDIVPSGSDTFLISGQQESLYMLNQGETIRLYAVVDNVRGNRWVAF